MIEVCDLTRSYGPHRGVKQVSFTLNPGQIVGLLGPNGAGKSTTIKVLTTCLMPTSGQVRVFGFDILKSAFEVRQLLGYLPETAPLYEDMVVKEFLSLVIGLRDLKAGQAREAFDRVVAQCALEGVLNRSIAQLSRGYRQRVGLAQALVHQPRFLVLDEPTSGLDPNQVIEMRQLIREIGQHSTVLFSSHILSEVEALCERVLILDQGRLVANGSPEDLRKTSTTILEVRAPFEKVKELLSHFGELKLRSLSENLTQAQVQTQSLEAREQLVAHLANQGFAPITVKSGSHELESVFSQLTGAQQ